MGDPIDNVPGIPGVGEKTAAKLIKKYGSAEKVLEHLRRADAEDAGKLREARAPARARQAAGHAEDRRRVRFRSPSSARSTGLNNDALRRHMEELGFRGAARSGCSNVPNKSAAAKSSTAPARSMSRSRRASSATRTSSRDAPSATVVCRHRDEHATSENVATSWSIPKKNSRAS